MAYEIASPLTYLVLQHIKRERQLNLGAGDSTHQRLQLVTGYSPRVFIADPDMGQPDPGDGAHPNPPSQAVGERE